MNTKASFQAPAADGATRPSLCREVVTSTEKALPISTMILRCGRLWLYSLPASLLFRPTERFKHIVTVNAEIFAYAHMNPDFERILAHTLNTIDGRVLQWVCRLLYPGWNICRLPGSDFIYELARYSSARAEGLFLLGASPESNRLAVEKLRAGTRNLKIAGYAPPFSSDIQQREWNQAILDRIEKFCPRHLVVCFGPVKQETWISLHADSLYAMGVRCAYGLGGTLDFVAGAKQRAPRWIQMAGAEWLFRLLCEPRQRLFRTISMFKMPYFAATTPCREIRLVAPASSELLMSDHMQQALGPGAKQSADCS